MLFCFANPWIKAVNSYLNSVASRIVCCVLMCNDLKKVHSSLIETILQLIVPIYLVTRIANTVSMFTSASTC